MVLPGLESKLCWLILDKWLNFSRLYCPHLLNGDNHSECLRGQIQRLIKLMYVTCLEQHLVCRNAWKTEVLLFLSVLAEPPYRPPPPSDSS